VATRSMSIFLLKKGSSVDAAIEEKHGYKEVTPGSVTPTGTRMFVRGGQGKPPWWKEYFGIAEDLWQQSNSAVAFVPVNDRTFALAFGSGHYLIRPESFDHEFGTRVALNAVDPQKLKSTDTLDPNSSQRRRTQLPFDADLALLSFTGDSSVLKSITGKAKEQYAELAKSVTGSSGLRLTTPVEASDIAHLLDELLELASSEDYLQYFPDVAKIRPVTDPIIIAELDAQLVSAIFNQDASIILTVPDILDYSDESYASFSGVGTCETYEDVYIKHYREYLEQHNENDATLTVEKLQRHRLLLLDGNGDLMKRWSIYKSLVFEVSLEKGFSYHLSDGTWYKVAETLVGQLRDYLDPHWVPMSLPEHKDGTEGSYNELVGELPGFVGLDKTNIAPDGQYQVEPCDLARLSGEQVELIHVKVGTSSDTLSHLFNQGVNSVQLIRTEASSLDKIIELIEAKTDTADSTSLVAALKDGRYKVAYAIITHKQTPEKKSDNLPLFSRISLRRQILALRSMGIDVTYQFVRDLTDKAGVKKERKKRAKELD
jgi:uncharacterized protein (TIGR04141 family)